MRLFPARPKKTDERRRRRFGLLLFFGSLLALFFLVRAVPADWEIGPFRIDASGNAADPQASLYFADDPHAPFWLLVPTFNLPSRFFAARPSASPPVALRPTRSPATSPTGSASLTPSSTPSATPTSTPTATPTPTPAPTPTPTPAPT